MRKPYKKINVLFTIVSEIVSEHERDKECYYCMQQRVIGDIHMWDKQSCQIVSP